MRDCCSESSGYHVLEPCASKGASTVLRRGGDGNVTSLSDRSIHSAKEESNVNRERSAGSPLL